MCVCVCVILLIIMHKTYDDLISIGNIFQAWIEFQKGKKKRADLQIFERYFEDNLFALQKALQNKTYRHGNYQSFYIQDPKKRHIHKAKVSDRVIHHLLYKYLYDLFDNHFIYDSYSCRLNKGTHKAVNRLVKFTRIISRNYTKPCWALHCDIKKFFVSVDHKTLIDLLERRIEDKNILWLLAQIINSFSSDDREHKGIPLGNLTSQIFANIYLNELDQFVKQDLRLKYYIRYADDFVLLSASKSKLEDYVNTIEKFLKENLKMELHPKKIIFRRLDWGIDFLGYVVLSYYVLPRTKTKKRLFKKLKNKISKDNFNESLQSYLGYLSHANSYKLRQKLKNQIWLWSEF